MGLDKMMSYSVKTEQSAKLCNNLIKEADELCKTGLPSGRLRRARDDINAETRRHGFQKPNNKVRVFVSPC